MFEICDLSFIVYHILIFVFVPMLTSTFVIILIFTYVFCAFIDMCICIQKDMYSIMELCLNSNSYLGLYLYAYLSA